MLDSEYIGNKGPSWHTTFADLALLHLYCSPRLVNSVPLQVNARALRSLDTIEIVWCGDLTTVFHVHGASDHGASHVIGWGLPMLKQIHLHELSRLRGIFGVCGERMHAPRFETIKIRVAGASSHCLVLSAEINSKCGSAIARRNAGIGWSAATPGC